MDEGNEGNGWMDGLLFAPHTIAVDREWFLGIEVGFREMKGRCWDGNDDFERLLDSASVDTNYSGRNYNFGLGQNTLCAILCCELFVAIL